MNAIMQLALISSFDLELVARLNFSWYGYLHLRGGRNPKFAAFCPIAASRLMNCMCPVRHCLTWRFEWCPRTAKGVIVNYLEHDALQITKSPPGKTSLSGL